MDKLKWALAEATKQNMPAPLPPPPAPQAQALPSMDITSIAQMLNTIGQQSMQRQMPQGGLSRGNILLPRDRLNITR